MGEKLYFTKRGLEKLGKELDELNKTLAALQAQMAHVAEVGGDQYHDNASYDLLTSDIRDFNNRIAAIHRRLNQATIVIAESPMNAESVALGTRVTVSRDGEEAIWEIVGFGESNPDRKLLAYNTPLASLIIGKRKGEVVEGVIGGKQMEVKILEISIGGGDEGSK